MEPAPGQGNRNRLPPIPGEEAKRQAFATAPGIAGSVVPSTGENAKESIVIGMLPGSDAGNQYLVDPVFIHVNHLKTKPVLLEMVRFLGNPAQNMDDKPA